MSPNPPLLAPDFETMDCARFLLHVTSLKRVFAPRERPKPIKKLCGRWLEKPTRKRFGVFEIEFDGVLDNVPAPKDMTITPEQITELFAKLKCPSRDALEAYLKSKRFVVRQLDTPWVKP